MLLIINEGACGNGITKIKAPSIMNDSYPAAFALKHLVKDLGLAKDAGLSSPLIILYIAATLMPKKRA
jgi:3-hydroxyisobutyrate dehydrogenase